MMFIEIPNGWKRASAPSPKPQSDPVPCVFCGNQSAGEVSLSVREGDSQFGYRNGVCVECAKTRIREWQRPRAITRQITPTIHASVEHQGGLILIGVGTYDAPKTQIALFPSELMGIMAFASEHMSHSAEATARGIAE